MKNHQNNTSEKRPESFNKKILTVVHLLHPYVKQRLRVAENLGILPKNMYQSNGIIDEVILSVYESKTNNNIDINELRLMMFNLINKKLRSLFEAEKWHKDTISTKVILEEELRLLEENFTVDADFDLIMNEELDDISYHQNDNESHLLQSDEVQQNILSFLDLKDKAFLKSEEKQDTLRKMYRNLPLQTSNVMDLYVLGKLNLQEIATILNTEIVEVKRIIDFVKENFKKHLI
ncbi:MAG: hypothetical protein KAH72_06895 [Flavobacteriaceae bacterium]|nr:hypothetical protein [Flavobacteriaceae bacterium]